MSLAQYRKELAEAAKKCFALYRQGKPNETFYAFALYDCDDGVGSAPSANTEERYRKSQGLEKTQALPADHEINADSRWGTAEWYEGLHSEPFHEMSISVEQLQEEYPDFVEYKAHLFAASMEALAEAGKDPLFDGVTKFFSISDSDDAHWLEIESAARCNSPEVFSKFRTELTRTNDDYAGKLKRPTELMRAFIKYYGWKSEPGYAPPAEVPPLNVLKHADTPIHRTWMQWQGKAYGPFDLEEYPILKQIAYGDVPVMDEAPMPMVFDLETNERQIELVSPPEFYHGPTGRYVTWIERVERAGVMAEVRAAFASSMRVLSIEDDIVGAFAPPSKAAPARRSMIEVRALLGTRIIGPLTIPEQRLMKLGSFERGDAALEPHAPPTVEHPKTGDRFIRINECTALKTDGGLRYTWMEYVPKSRRFPEGGQFPMVWDPAGAEEERLAREFFDRTKCTKFATLVELQATPRLEGEYVVALSGYSAINVLASTNEKLLARHEAGEDVEGLIEFTDIERAKVLTHDQAIQYAVRLNVRDLKEFYGMDDAEEVMALYVGRKEMQYEPTTLKSARTIATLCKCYD